MDYVISDLHLGHGNIIDYCDRPFDSVAAMDETPVENWNATIDPGDEVLCGGDLTVPWVVTHLLDWLDRHHGDLMFLVGNHEETVFPERDGVAFRERFRFEHRGVPLPAVHDPADGSSNSPRWLLHSHHHNNWPDEFPFVDHDQRRANFSVELLDYLARGDRFADRAAAESTLEDDDG